MGQRPNYDAATLGPRARVLRADATPAERDRPQEVYVRIMTALRTLTLAREERAVPLLQGDRD